VDTLCKKHIYFYNSHESLNMHIQKPCSEVPMQAMHGLGDTFIPDLCVGIVVGIVVAELVVGAKAIAVNSQGEGHSRRGRNTH
jgi:hypothetical protein